MREGEERKVSLANDWGFRSKNDHDCMEERNPGAFMRFRKRTRTQI